MQIKSLDWKHDTVYDKASETYKYVYSYYNIKTNESVFIGQLKAKNLILSWSSNPYTTEKEAAKAVDIELIRRGLEPVNILKKL